jgi:hypothetical protein
MGRVRVLQDAGLVAPVRGEYTIGWTSSLAKNEMTHKTFFQDASRSTIQEHLVEAWFVRDFILHATKRHRTPLIGHSDMDLFGFDLILGLDGSPAFLLVQLKAYGGRTRSWDVHKALLQKGGQVVVARVDYSTEEPAISYHVLTPAGRKRALEQAPRKAHPGKCKVSKADLREVKDLMELFGV